MEQLQKIVKVSPAQSCVGTVPMFRMHNVGTSKIYDLYLKWEFGLYGKKITAHCVSFFGAYPSLIKPTPIIFVHKFLCPINYFQFPINLENSTFSISNLDFLNQILIFKIKSRFLKFYLELIHRM